MLGRESVPFNMTATTNCRDVREWLLAISHGTISLTERALVEVHLAQCAQCRRELAQLRQTANLRRRVTWSQAPPALIRKVLEAARPTRLLAPLRQLVRRSIPLVAPVSAGVILALVAFAIYVANKHHDQPAQSSAASLEAPGTESFSAPSIVDEPVVDEPIARSSAVSVPVTEPAEPSRVAVAGAEPKQLPAPAALVGQRAAPVSSPPHTPTPNLAPAKFPPQAEPMDSGPVSPTDVIGLLQVRDRDAAWRDLVALLVRTGGTELGSHRDFTLLALVPQVRYGEFAEGLIQIGAWRLEAGRSPLPDQVSVTIRLSL